MHTLLTKKIKEKKGLENLDDDFVEGEIEDFLSKNRQIAGKTDFENEKNFGFKAVLKAVRSGLNKRYGIFKLDEKMELESHSSSKERMGFYNQLYEKIFRITGVPRSILDIGCGLNPLSIRYMKGFNGKYTGIEVSRKDCEMLNDYFRKNKINGIAIQQDIRKDFSFQEADVVFLFKVLDSVEEKGHKLAEKILSSLRCRFAVVSFATKTARGQEMNFPRRGWFERMLERLGLKHERIAFENEVFYVVKIA